MRTTLKLVFSVMLVALAVESPATRARATPMTNDGTISLEKGQAAFDAGVARRPQVLLARKHFSEATDLYIEVHRSGVRSPALYRNIGNAAVLADRWPEAVWAYHSGLMLDPNDDRMRAHLAFVRAKVIHPPAGQGRLDPDSWPSWLHRPSLDELFWTCVLFYFLLCCLGTCVFLFRTRLLGASTGATVALLLGAGIACWWSFEKLEADREKPIAVLIDNTPFHKGNGPSYPQHALLPLLARGMEVRQLHTRGNWLQVQLNSGEVGWIPASAALVVTP